MESHAEKTPHLRPEVTIAILREAMKGYLPELVGMEIMALTVGKVNGRLQVHKALMAPNGFLHAATIIALADTCCGMGTIAHLPDGASLFTTVELKCNFLGTVREGSITCEAELVQTGRHIQVWDATVKSEDTGQRLCLFRCTQMILWPK
jgi:1,4-dihydroxy-2-naphthoyl-CoA hydrolase